MATLALAAVLTEMHVVWPMAVGAGRTQFHLIGRLPVAARADELCVRAGEREVGFLRVVELPDSPAVR